MSKYDIIVSIVFLLFILKYFFMIIEDQNHLKFVCKNCRFLKLTPIGFQCLKFSHLSEDINENTDKRNYFPKGNNCNYPLVDFLKLREELKDKKILFFNKNNLFFEGFIENFSLSKLRKEIIINSYLNFKKNKTSFNLKELEIIIGDNEIILKSKNIFKQILTAQIVRS